MGDLPKQRVSIMYPFQVSGVDYAGPFSIKDRKGRGCKITKAYICLFVCFSTKALHLEVASDLSTESFLAALKRFTARRGKPNEIFSDNGRNFIGAKNELLQLVKFLKDQRKILPELLANQGIDWHFIPPHSPHMGGLWEAGVKSVKRCLKKLLMMQFLPMRKCQRCLSKLRLP